MGCIPKTSPFEEMKLLEKAQQPPFNTYIRIHDYAETDVQQLASARCLSFVASYSKLTAAIVSYLDPHFGLVSIPFFRWSVIDQ
jgi:hypothetical protein